MHEYSCVNTFCEIQSCNIQCPCAKTIHVAENGVTRFQEKKMTQIYLEKNFSN